MECKDFREQFTALLSDSLHQKQRIEIESHLAECSDCRKEFEDARKIWDLMGDIPQPEPSVRMQDSFDVILANFKEQVKVKRNPVGEWLNRIREYLALQAQPRMAFSILLIAIGLAGGYLLHQPAQSAISYNKQIDSLSSQVSQMKQVMMFSLLNDPSASQRIRAVSYTDESSKVDLKVVGALFTTLNEDPNVNVRLAAAYALDKYADQRSVCDSLLRSLSFQDEPILQITLINILSERKEKSAFNTFLQIIGNKSTMKEVKAAAENGVKRLL